MITHKKCSLASSHKSLISITSDKTCFQFQVVMTSIKVERTVSPDSIMFL